MSKNRRTTAEATEQLITTSQELPSTEPTNPLDEYGPIINYPKPSEESLEGLMEQYKTKSAVMRYLESIGWTRGKIAKFMGVRYQHVRNVLIQPLKKNG